MALDKLTNKPHWTFNFIIVVNNTKKSANMKGSDGRHQIHLDSADEVNGLRNTMNVLIECPNMPMEVLESTGDGIEEVNGDHMRDIQSKMMGDGNDEQNGDNDSDNRESSSDVDPQMSACLPTPKNVRQQLTFVTKVIHPTHRASTWNH
ncbi:hypothetical protein V8B97DRAFT_1917200 [Scleroderma yunnanense]